VLLSQGLVYADKTIHNASCTKIVQGEGSFAPSYLLTRQCNGGVVRAEGKMLQRAGP
jgi:hypothetical protein